MSAVSTTVLVSVFAVAGAAVWFAGIYLARATDCLDDRLKLGEALGGLILLAIAGTLPELAITVTAALQGNLGLAAGNLIGGIAVQTMVLAILDIAVPGDKPLSYLVGSLLPMLEALLVVTVTAIVLMGSLLPPSVAIHGVSPASVLVVVIWVLGLAIINRVRKAPGWRSITMPGARPGRPHRRMPHPTYVHPYRKKSTAYVAAVFGAGALVTLAAGVALEVTGDQLATRAGVNGVVFGATVLALITALPEISTGLAAVRLGDNQLAMSDIFGGNAFQVCLFVVADVIAGKPVLAEAGVVDAWLAALGIVLSVVYGASVVVRPSNRYFRLGADSLLALVLFGFGIVGLVLLAR